MPDNELALLLSVDDLRPGVGGDVDFTLSVNSFNPTISQGTTLIGGIEIKAELSDGLQFKSSWTRPTGFTTSGRSATWTPADVKKNDPEEVVIETQLTSDSLDDIPLEERCITARVTDSIPPPGPDYALGSLKQCLGGPSVLLEEGSVAFLTSFPCIDDTHTDAHQCESVPGVAVAARLPSRHPDYVESDDIYANLRSHDVGRTDETTGSSNLTVFVDPESVIIQVKDPEGRVQDSHTHSVSDVSWQTARKALSGMNRAVDGVTITYTRKDIKDASAWNSLGPRILTVTRADGTTPGKVKIRLNSSGNQFFDLSTGTATRNAFNVTSVSTSVTPYFAEFETLGTYLIKYDLTLTDSSSNAFTDSGTYTFHVGPIVELEVSDGGQNPAVPPDQRAFTIVAVNNGPDAAPAAQVTVTDLNASDYVSHTATAGSFDSGTGIWTIGELNSKEASEFLNGRDGEVLTIITAAPVNTEITAEIENTQDYQVCIDSDGDDVELSSPSETACTTEDATNTWHTAKYYDYIDDNDSATIKAKDGTGADLPSLQSPEPKTAAIEVTWDPITEVNGWQVTHYEVQRETNPWVTVADNLVGTEYVDTNVDVGDTFRYRVRAVNDRDHKGPWSQPMSGTVAEAEIEPPGRPTGMRAAPVSGTEILVFWSTPAGAVVDHYELQVSEDEGANWDPLDDNLAANSYNHTGLQEGDTRHYRVRAWNTDDPKEEGDWSATVSATTDAAAPPPPPPPPPRVITRTETVTVGETPFARFSPTEVSRSVAENSVSGSAVGAPVAVLRNSGNRVTYSLEGTDASLFTIEADTGQILVGQDTVLDYESDTTSYTVEVVADPSSGSNVRATVTITVTDVAETATVAITPAGQPQVDVELTATLTHGGGEPTDPAWQWQRSDTGGTWLNIAGATAATYTPTAQDAGKRLRVIVFYGEPGGGYGVAGAATEALAGGATTETAPLSDLVAGYDADGDGSIDLNETLATIAAYFAEDLDLDGVLEVIAAYFAG